MDIMFTNAVFKRAPQAQAAATFPSRDTIHAHHPLATQRDYRFQSYPQKIYANN